MAVLGDIYKLALLTRMGGVEMVNTFWFRQAFAVMPPDERATLANDFVGTMVTPGINSIRWACHGLVQFHTVTVQQYLPYSDSVFTLPINPVQVGMGAGPELPPICSGCVTITTAKGGRRGRGRIYFPPTQQNSQLSGVWGAVQIGNYNAVLSTLNGRYVLAGGVAASGFIYGVWSRADAGSSPPFNGSAFAPMTGWQVRSQVRALSRRTAP